MQVPLNSFIYDKLTGIHSHPDNGCASFDYSDGLEVEERIFNILKETKDHGLFSRELCSYITDWPTEYHFSPVRHNLLRHLNLKKTDKVLELGCGCGAITRQLGESGANITSIDGSTKRAKCAKERCSNLENVNVYCSNFQDILFDQQYDYVTLIGVLEYSSLFFKGNEPFKQCLEIAKSALKKDGKLIIAIENRLGLKYILGYSEDHTGKEYDGLNNFYDRNTAYTFGKKELTDLLMQNGFEDINFAYPFPDYKLPKLVLFETAFTLNSFKASNLISSSISRDYSFPSKVLPSDYFIWKQLDMNKILPDLANSFLIEASLSQIDNDESLIAKYYTVDRKCYYNTTTSFINENRQIKVLKKKIDSHIDNHKSNLVQVLQEENYCEGDSLDYLIRKTIAKEDLTEFAKLLKSWIDLLISKAILKKNEINIFLSIINPKFIDCIPYNIIVNNYELQVIDSEWAYYGTCTLYSLIIRYLSDLELVRITHCIKGSKSPLHKLFQYLGIHFENKYYVEYSEMEREIIQSVYDECYSKIKGNYINNTPENFNYTRKIKLKIKNGIKIFLK